MTMCQFVGSYLFLANREAQDVQLGATHSEAVRQKRETATDSGISNTSLAAGVTV